MKANDPVTKAQLSKIHVLLNQMDLIEHKAFLVFQFSRERTDSSKELTAIEAKELIQHLVSLSGSEQVAERMRKKVFALAYSAGIIYGDSAVDKKLNPITLDKFLIDRGTVRKKINQMNKEELIKTVSQFELIIKHKAQTSANKATNSLLEELNIPVEKNSVKKTFKEL